MTICNLSIKEEWNKNDGFEYMYHFTTLESLIKILITDSFRLSSVNYMNDINEALPSYKVFNKSEKEIQEEKNIRSRTFLGCFNILQDDETIRDKTSLWGHYASSCSGVCLKINKRKFDKLLFNIIYDIQNDAKDTRAHISKFKIKYQKQSEINKHKYVYSKRTGLPFYIELECMLSKKSSEWKVENEFRYLVYNDSWCNNMDYFYIDNFITTIEAIYVGENMNDYKLLNSIKVKLDNGIKFYKRDNYTNDEVEL